MAVWTKMNENKKSNDKKDPPIKRLVWFIDKRLFSWGHIPSLAELKIIKKSYSLLIILPILDQVFSPILSAPDGLKIAIDVDWILVLPEGSRIAIELGIPFTWKYIYFLVLFVGVGSIIYELWCPDIVKKPKKREVIKKATQQVVLQEFRKTAMQLRSNKRMNHFINNFLENYSDNYADLKEPDSEHPGITPVLDGQSNERLSVESLYFAAEKMNIKENKLEGALENIKWFANEGRAIARWISGLFFCGAIIIFTILLGQGLMRIL